MKNIIFISPPSAGKGTQSEMLVNNYGYKHISMGDLLRDVVNEGSPLGREIAEIQANGGLVSDDIVNKLLYDALSKSEIFILDGYPRNLNQAENLNNLFEELNCGDYIVLYLDIDEVRAMERALGRVTCSGCGTSYNIYYEQSKPQKTGICDKCSTPLVQRNDDNEDSFRKRFETYQSNVEPVLDYYKNKKILKYIKVEDGKYETYKHIEEALND